MTDGNLPGRDDRPTRSQARVAPMRWPFVAAFALVLLVASSPPAEAQRPGRRWRTPPPAPRPQSAPRTTPQPSAPAGAVGAPRTGSDQAAARQPTPRPSAAAGKDGKQDGKQDGKGSAATAKQPGTEAPQTASAPEAPPSSPSGALVWDGPAPFSDAWRADHPGAWRPEERPGEVVFAGGSVPTQVDAGAVDVAQWTATKSHSDAAAPRSVLQASAEVAIPDAAIPPSDLVVFPGADGGLPEAESPPPTPAGAPTTAPDGTVSVLVRDGGDGASTAAPKGGASATVSLSHDDASSPWLPLGTFAAVPAGSDRGLAPHVFLELALHRDGTVRGNYFDAVSDAVQPVTGRFDRDTGSLSWRIGRGGAEFVTTAEGLAGGRGEATVRRGATQRPWLLIGLP